MLLKMLDIVSIIVPGDVGVAVVVAASVEVEADVARM